MDQKTNISSMVKQSMPVGSHTLRFGERTYLMGILNVTPDSFSDGGVFQTEQNAVKHALDMIRDGADFIDIGGESSRPGHIRIDEEEELNRIIPIIKSIRKLTNVPISVDTIRAGVAEAALDVGANMLNDIWGLQMDRGMAKVAATYRVPVVIMHNQDGTEYKGDLVEEILTFFEKSIQIALDAGLSRDRIILDPGIGFGKTAEQNIVVLSRLSEIKAMGFPVLLGTSRKSFLGKILDLPPLERMEGTVATTVLGIAQGVDIVRVHDVKENARAARVADAILR